MRCVITSKKLNVDKYEQQYHYSFYKLSTF